MVPVYGVIPSGVNPVSGVVASCVVPVFGAVASDGAPVSGLVASVTHVPGVVAPDVATVSGVLVSGVASVSCVVASDVAPVWGFWPRFLFLASLLLMTPVVVAYDLAHFSGFLRGFWCGLCFWRFWCMVLPLFWA